MRVLTVALALMFVTPAQAMPWPCWIVKQYAKRYTPAQLEKMARDRGVTVSQKDRADVRECLRGK